MGTSPAGGLEEGQFLLTAEGLGTVSQRSGLWRKHRISVKGGGQEGKPGCSARPRALASLFQLLRPHWLPPFLSSGVALPPFPHPSLHTHCLRAGAHAPPGTGSRGASGPPLLTHDSWIHTERQRVGCWALAGGQQDPSGQCHFYAKQRKHRRA